MLCLLCGDVLQLSVQGDELLHEASVWKNPAFLLHAAHRRQESAAMVNHQVGQDQRCGATHAHSTVHQHLSCRSQKRRKQKLAGGSKYFLAQRGRSSSFYLLKSEPGE